MSSASGDEAEHALAEPGKKETPSRIVDQSNRLPRPVAEAIVRPQRRALGAIAQPTRPPFRSGVLYIANKYFSFTFSVRRTRSGRARKTVVAKKSPVKKLLARATRSPRNRSNHEIEEPEV